MEESGAEPPSPDIQSCPLIHRTSTTFHIAVQPPYWEPLASEVAINRKIPYFSQRKVSSHRAWSPCFFQFTLTKKHLRLLIILCLHQGPSTWINCSHIHALQFLISILKERVLHRFSFAFLYIWKTTVSSPPSSSESIHGPYWFIYSCKDGWVVQGPWGNLLSLQILVGRFLLMRVLHLPYLVHQHQGGGFPKYWWNLFPLSSTGCCEQGSWMPTPHTNASVTEVDCMDCAMACSILFLIGPCRSQVHKRL